MSSERPSPRERSSKSPTRWSRCTPTRVRVTADRSATTIPADAVHDQTGVNCRAEQNCGTGRYRSADQISEEHGEQHRSEGSACECVPAGSERRVERRLCRGDCPDTGDDEEIQCSARGETSGRVNSAIRRVRHRRVSARCRSVRERRIPSTSPAFSAASGSTRSTRRHREGRAGSGRRARASRPQCVASRGRTASTSSEGSGVGVLRPVRGRTVSGYGGRIYTCPR